MNAQTKPAGGVITPEHVLHVLAVKHTASADETAQALIELNGISSEDGVAETKIEVENILRRLRDEGKIIIVSDAGEEMRFARIFDET